MAQPERAADTEGDGLDQVRRAVLVLADRQTAVLDAIAGQGIRLDALTATVQGTEAKVTALLDALNKDGDGKLAELVEAVTEMASDLRELRDGTATMANAVKLLAERLG